MIAVLLFHTFFWFLIVWQPEFVTQTTLVALAIFSFVWGWLGKTALTENRRLLLTILAFNLLSWFAMAVRLLETPGSIWVYGSLVLCTVSCLFLEPLRRLSQLFLKKTAYLVGWFNIVLVSSYGFVTEYCQGLQRLDFDSQNFFTWTYTAFAGFVPYRDIFYLYGLVPYWFLNSGLVRVGLWLWLSLMIALLAMVLKAVSRSNPFTVLSLFVVSGLIQFSTGFEATFRYGTAITLVTLIVALLADRRSATWALITGGALLSLGFMALSDQGIYAAMAVGVWLLLEAFSGREPFSWLRELRRAGLFGLGVFVGALPLVIYLVQTQSLMAFVEQMKLISTMTVFAKMPFFGGQFTASGWFTLVTLLFSGVHLVWHWLNLRTRFATKTVGWQLTWTIVLLLFQFKNMTRPSIELQFIPFTASLALLMLATVWKNPPKTLSLQVLRWSFFLTVVGGFWLSLQPLSTMRLNLTRLVHSYTLAIPQAQKIKPSPLSAQRACVAAQIDTLENRVSEPYLQTSRWLETELSPSESFFSFPGDPILHVLTATKPAPFFNAYDASALTAEEKNLRYLEQEDLRYVVLNAKETRIQNNIQNHVRNKKLFAALLTQFEPVQRFEQFVILKRVPARPSSVTLNHPLIREDVFLSEELSQTELGMIPHLEGLYKLSALEKESAVVAEVSLTRDQLTPLALEVTPKTVVVVKPSSLQSDTRLEFFGQQASSSAVVMSQCGPDSPCLLNLQALPLLMGGTTLTAASSSAEVKLEFRESAYSSLW